MLVLALLASCGDDGACPPDGVCAPPDGGADGGRDAGPSDGGRDGGVADAGRDGGAVDRDAGPPDAGVEPCVGDCLVLHYDFEDEPTIGLSDRSGNGLDAALVMGAANTVDGPVGSAWQLDQEVDEYVAADPERRLGLPEQYTIAFWVRVDTLIPSLCCFQRVVSLDDPTGEPVVQVPVVRSFTDPMTPELLPTAYADPGDGEALLVRGLETDTWYHFAIVGGVPGPGAMRWFQDGVPRELPVTWPSPTRSIGRLRIGGPALSSGEVGGVVSMDELYVYARALSDLEVEALAIGTAP